MAASSVETKAAYLADSMAGLMVSKKDLMKGARLVDLWAVERVGLMGWLKVAVKVVLKVAHLVVYLADSLAE